MDAAIGARLGLALSPFDGATNSVVAALDLDPGKRSGRHTHSIEEVILVLAGTAGMTVGDEPARLSVGDVVLVPARVPHEIANVGSGELRTVAFFPNAAVVSVFDEVLSPVESRVLVVPPPDEGPADAPAEGVVGTGLAGAQVGDG